MEWDLWHLEPNDLVVIYLDMLDGDEDTLKNIQLDLEKKYPFPVTCIVIPSDGEIEVIAEAQMNELGWYRK